MSRVKRPVLRSRCLIAIALAVAAPGARADFQAYSGTANLKARGGPTTAEHHHDWRKHEAYVRILDSQSGRELRKLTSPALTTLWVTPDGAYVVGLSQIKSENRNQLFVVSRDGSFVHQEGVLCSDPRLDGLPCTESTTNAVFWYDETQPDIDLALGGGRPSELSVNDWRSRLCRGQRPEGFEEKEWRELCPEPRRRVRLRLSPPAAAPARP